ncbi:MAG: polysaccharide pyruvyl transferase family protein, partial [Verrucomicrobiota bacterium]
MNFLFVGNGSYQNRGCEAIVRGTMEILRREFGRDISVRAGVHTDVDIVREQNDHEIEPAIQSFSVSGTGARLSLKWLAAQANKRLGAKFAPHIWDLIDTVRDASMALELGGDNYSLDYGRPETFMAMDRFLLKQGTPVVLWGASVGPFDADQEFAPRMFDHLRKLAAIFVRETESLEYLRANGVSENVYLVADPAFVM